MMEQTVSIERMEDAIDIFGSFDENIRLIEQELGGPGGGPGRPAENQRGGYAGGLCR